MELKSEFEIDFKKLLLRYVSFWPYFLISIAFFIIATFIHLRYADYYYSTESVIQILDKSKDSEMALPTEVTIFNRSTVNLENEIEVLRSYRLISTVVKKLNSNIKYYSIGEIKTTENHKTEWLSGIEYELVFDENIDYEILSKQQFLFSFSELGLTITSLDNENNEINTYQFNNFDTDVVVNDLPFSFKLTDNISFKSENDYILEINRPNLTVNNIIKNIKIKSIGKNSDLIEISLLSTNRTISEELINELTNQFNLDGIYDRQMVFKSTIDFVNSRFTLLKSELEGIELNKQLYKETNNLTDVEFDASISSGQKTNYENELFLVKSQLDLTKLLRESVSNINSLEYIPSNVGIENENLNNLINNYNLLVSENFKLSQNAGVNNIQLRQTQNQIENLLQNVIISIDNYDDILQTKIDKLQSKEDEFNSVYKNLPENQRVLRSIVREQEIKEALFLLLLQKKEEAAINYAVTKPSIKVIDFAKSSILPVSPIKIQYLLFSIVISFILPISLLSIWFYFDNKIHTRDQLLEKTDNIPLIGELPHLSSNIDITELLANTDNRNQFAECIRMLIANLKISMSSWGNSQSDLGKIILVTSSVKGEGKTILSTGLSSILSNTYRVLVIGADLRNPQIHNNFGLDRNVKGISDYIYKDDLKWKELIFKMKNLDLILSGTIPPNPTEMLSSKKFSDLLHELKSHYDYIIIDSAPCILVSDTLEISNIVDGTVYVVRSNFTDYRITNFINECHNDNKLKNINLVLNGVGNSKSYGYNYSYKYGYNYAYNYGYGYGYSKDD